ncbi:MAG: hypothetical protein NUV69_03425 [Candidatus Curtissbacteria bacterium]|nr:hypothetical protein [Candidatus Curtissbacteria bacterium]
MTRSHLVTRESVRWNIPEDFEGILAYNPRHDIQDYLDLQPLRGKIPQTEYESLLDQTNDRTYHNLEKTLGERLAVERSTFHYYLDDESQLWSDDYPLPVIERYKKGQQFLEENGSNEVERELAEIDGFEEIIRLLAERRDVTLVVASPRSERCKHGEEEEPKGEDDDILYHDNIFYVIEQNGETITANKYHSNHSNAGFLDALCQVDPGYQRPNQEQTLNAAYMLSRPAETKFNLPQILENFALDNRAKNTELLQEALEPCIPYFLAYIRTLADTPLAIERLKMIWNTTLNTFDEEVEKIKQKVKKVKQDAFTKFKQEKAKILWTSRNLVRTNDEDIEEQIQIKGRRMPKTSRRGCPGKQKGFSLTPAISRLAKAISAQSAADFAPSTNDAGEDDSDFPCPRCGTIIIYGSGTTECPRCGLEATCAE